MNWIPKTEFKRLLLTEAKDVFGDRCFYCGEAEGSTIDHLLPRSLGGKNTVQNIVPSCSPCNTKKRNRLPTTNEMAKHREAWRKYNAQ